MLAARFGTAAIVQSRGLQLKRSRPAGGSLLKWTPGGRPFSAQRAVSMLDNEAEDVIRQIPLADCRNFCFIAHVDHGKSSLSSRILELTGNLGHEAQKIAQKAATQKQQREDDEGTQQSAPPKITESSEKEQYLLLDTLSVEKQRGITVKASAATMLYKHPSAIGPTGMLLLNMTDTPGHVDFGREVARSLNFVQGAMLLLDASQGIQAQTTNVYFKAKSMENPPELLLALTKVDLDAARPIHVALTVSEWLDWDDPDNIIHTSARSRIGIAEVLDRICALVPPPPVLEDDADDSEYEAMARSKTFQSDKMILRAQVVDSWYDDRGVNCLVQIVSGEMLEGDRIVMAASSNSCADDSNASGQKQQSFSVQEVGVVLPQAKRTGVLRRGQMGYVRFGLRDPRQAQPGTILILQKHVGRELALPKLANVEDATNSVLYASVHPGESDGFDELCNAVDRLALNDTGLEVSKTAALSGGSEKGGPFLGPGLRVGFQGILHMEVFRQRLLDEFEIEAIVTPPKVSYRITTKEGTKGQPKGEKTTRIVEDLADWPGQGVRFSIEEPMVTAEIMAPAECTGAVMELISRRRGIGQQSRPFDEETWIFTAQMPWAEVVVDFHDHLKNVTGGFGSLDTSPGEPPYLQANVSKIEIMLNGDIVEPLAFVAHKNDAQSQARVVCKKLQEVLPRMQFVTVIQAKADGRIIASERIRAYRKDVLVKSGKVVGGGDQTRKKKLLEKQKKGKKTTTSRRKGDSFSGCLQQRNF